MERLEELRLVKQAKQGNIEAFGSLYREVYKDLYRFALFTLKHQRDAEDVVGDTVTDAFEGIRSLRKEEAFRSWIFQILANKCRRQLKVYAKQPVLQEYEEAGNWEFPIETGDRTKEELLDLRQAFGQLPEEDRLIVALFFFGGYSSTEIAGIVRKPPGTVRSRQSRALARMRGLLAGKGPETGGNLYER